jgi:hypothetical protein
MPQGTALEFTALAANATTFTALLPAPAKAIELSIANQGLPTQSHDSSFSSYHPAGP